MLRKCLILILMAPTFAWWAFLLMSSSFPSWPTPFVIAGGVGLLGTLASVYQPLMSYRVCRMLTILFLCIGIGTVFSGLLIVSSLYFYLDDPVLWEGIVFYVIPLGLALYSGILSLISTLNTSISEREAPNNQLNKGLGLRRAH